MEILPTNAQDYAPIQAAGEIQTTLLKKAQDIAEGQMKSLLQSVNLPTQGQNFDKTV